MKTRVAKAIMDSFYSLSPTELLKEDWPPEMVAMLSNHDNRDRLVMGRIADDVIDCRVDNAQIVFTVDIDRFLGAKNHILEKRRQRHLIEAFIQQGASTECMSALFGMNRHEVASHRKLLGIKTNGRPSVEHEDDIVTQWNHFRERGSDERTAILEISYKLSEPIANIWMVIKKSSALRNQSVARYIHSSA